ncbi:LTA synthase family protein [Hydrogenibacillus schlegelii]|uniref:Sulfatase N-terminal domain-containing protein n=1 Tax=Hydrogenibacillus schlegelii TaxID=1484 RepID=A0A132MGY9_HYDSH|nr:LTA synthase family protein [Hydrogenibacillus schlegelii]KWW97120.1 hypothetical protein TR75_10315 [Hydrogenibacillus schlegelii]OAR03852.1 hypothetical protein SA87_03170 [Hydrogenibacillus schlegelii]
MAGEILWPVALGIKLVYAGAIMGGGVTASGAFWSLVAALALGLLPGVFRPERQPWVRFGMNVAVSALLFADLLYFRYFGRPMSIYALLQVNNLGGLGGSLESLWSWREWVVWADVPAAYVFARRSCRRPKPSIPALQAVFFGLVAAAAVGGIWALMAVRTAPAEAPAAFSGGESRPAVGRGAVQRYGPLGHHVVDALAILREGEAAANPQALEEIAAWFRRHDPELRDSFDNPWRGWAQGMNLVLIQVESLHNFVLDLDIEGIPVTPNLRRLREHALYFPHFYPQTIEGNSSDAELLSQTSLYPAARGAAFYRFAGAAYPSLAKKLRAQGYAVLAVHGDRASYWNRAKMYPGLGLEPFVSLEHLEADEIIGMGLSDRSLFCQTAERLTRTPEPFYAFVITLSSHLPFELPEEERTLPLPPELDGTIVGRYLESIHYVDRALGEFIAALNQAGLAERTLIALYGDHDGLLWHKDRDAIEAAFGGPIDFEAWVRTYQPVPFLIYHPRLAGETVATIGGEVDIAPTLSNLLGLPASAWAGQAMGRSLLAPTPSYAVLPGGDYAEPAFIDPDGIRPALPAWAEEALRVADLIHLTRYVERTIEEGAGAGDDRSEGREP